MVQTIYSYGEADYFSLRPAFKRQPPDLTHCAMCSRPLRIVPLQHPQWYADFPDSGITIVNGTYATVCDNCGWWMARTHGEHYEISSGWDMAATGCLKKFSADSATIPTQILLEWIKREKNLDFHVLDPHVFEKLVADVLRFEYAPCEVKHVGVKGGGGDGGIDIYVIRGNEQWLVQVKRRIKATAEPIETIRSLNGVLLREGQHRGIVVTSAKKFTRNATTEAQIKTPGPYCVRLIDRGVLLDIVRDKAAVSTEPWLTAVENAAPWMGMLEDLPQQYLQLFIDASAENADRLARSMRDLTEAETETAKGTIGAFENDSTSVKLIRKP